MKLRLALNSCYHPLHVIALPQEFVHSNLVYFADAIHAGLILAESAEFGRDVVERRTEIHAGILQNLVLVMSPYVQHDLQH